MGHVWLVGMMGSGKSTVGRHLAYRLEKPFYDTDEVVEQAGQTSIVEIFAREGEAGFRERERSAVEEVASRPAGVIATGGGVVLDPANVATMRSSGVVVLLAVDSETLSQRLVDGGDRPLLADRGDELIPTILLERDEQYRSTADVVIDATGALDGVVAEVEAACSDS